MTVGDGLKTALGALIGVGVLYAIEPAMASRYRGGKVLVPAMIAGVGMLSLRATGYVGLGVAVAALISAADNLAVERMDIDLV